MNTKYNRTYHLPFSPEVHSDDKVISTLEHLLNVEVIITEKLDGGNACIYTKKVFARSHSEEASHPSFSMIKQMLPMVDIHNKYFDYFIFGENMQGIHSIEYSNLTSPFYIFNIKKGNKWLSWEEVEKIASELKIPTVPVIYKGIFKTEKDLKKFLDREINKPSSLGGDREGFVIRVAKAFEDKDFTKKIAKYVRKGHIQTDKHWSKNWKQAKINFDFSNFF